MDLYGSFLAKALFPAFEAARGRPMFPLLRYLRDTERWSPAQLRDLQVGLLRRLLRHAQLHSAHYREIFEERDLRFDDFHSIEDLAKLPLLDRATVRQSLESRISAAPPNVAISKTTSGSSGEPVVVKYNRESRYWRDAIRWRGYGWGGYEIGMRALHYWGFGSAAMTRFQKYKLQLDRTLKRDLYLDSTPRDEASFAQIVAEIKRFKPNVMIGYASAAAALARFVVETNARAWDGFPVLTGAEALMDADRGVIEQAFGTAFDTYGCREVMMIGSECEQHDGLHTAMENVIVEIVVREPDGTSRAAKPGELGDVVVTDLHNLACPMIRYITGDLAVARGDERCACGRGLVRIGPVQGRVSETLYDGAGRPVGGIVFSIVFAKLGASARNWQVHQRADRSIVLKLVPYAGTQFPEAEIRELREYIASYLPGAPLSIEIVADIPLTAAGKRRVVVVDKAS